MPMYANKQEADDTAMMTKQILPKHVLLSFFPAPSSLAYLPLFHAAVHYSPCLAGVGYIVRRR